MENRNSIWEGDKKKTKDHGWTIIKDIEQMLSDQKKDSKKNKGIRKTNHKTFIH